MGKCHCKGDQHLDFDTVTQKYKVNEVGENDHDGYCTCNNCETLDFQTIEYKKDEC